MTISQMFESFVQVTSIFRRTTGHYNVGLTLKYLTENICIMPLSIVDYTEIFFYCSAFPTFGFAHFSIFVARNFTKSDCLIHSSPSTVTDFTKEGRQTKKESRQA